MSTTELEPIRGPAVPIRGEDQTAPDLERDTSLHSLRLVPRADNPNHYVVRCEPSDGSVCRFDPYPCPITVGFVLGYEWVAERLAAGVATPVAPPALVKFEPGAIQVNVTVPEPQVTVVPPPAPQVTVVPTPAQPRDLVIVRNKDGQMVRVHPENDLEATT